MTIILPECIENEWQDAIAEANPDQWDELACDLLRYAVDERSDDVRDDILTLALIAGQHASYTLDTWCLRQLEAA